MLVLLGRRYTQFLNNNPSLQDPLVREQCKALGPEYLKKHGPLAIPSSSLVFSARITDSAVLRMLQFEEKIARCQKAIDEKKLETAGPRPEEKTEPEAEVETPAVRRAGFVDPILRGKGMSRSKWASKAGVDPSVVYDYLKGNSSPDPKPEGIGRSYRAISSRPARIETQENQKFPDSPIGRPRLFCPA